MSHVDQLAVIVRYVLDGIPMERFLTFIDIHSHISANLAATFTSLFFWKITLVFQNVEDRRMAMPAI